MPPSMASVSTSALAKSTVSSAPNGAGKTTTLRILAGLMRPSHGEVSIHGVSGADDPMVLKERAGFLTANTGLYARLTPRETLSYFARLRGVPEATLPTQVDSLITLLDLKNFADRRCDGMSTGERQRVQIARTLIGDPPVLILDEPHAWARRPDQSPDPEFHPRRREARPHHRDFNAPPRRRRNRLQPLRPDAPRKKCSPKARSMNCVHSPAKNA